MRRPMAGERNKAKANRLVRLSMMLRNRPRTMQELIDEFGVVERSIQRDLSDLREIFGCELEPRNGYYSLGGEDSFKAPSLTMDELWALFLACRTMELRGAFPLQAKSALEKLTATARSMFRRSLEDLDRAVELEPSPHQDSSPEFLRLALEANRLRRSVEVVYRALQSEEGVRRKFDPWGAFLRQDQWYLVGFDHYRGKQLTFKLARVQELKILQDTFKLPDGFLPGSAIFHIFDVGPGDPVRVRLKVDPELARQLEETRSHPSQKLNGELVEYEVRNPLHMVRWLLGLGKVEVLEPRELREELARQAMEIATRNGF